MFEERETKRPLLKAARLRMLAAFSFGISASISALSAFTVPRVIFLYVNQSSMVETQGMIWLAACVIGIIFTPLWSSLSDRHGSKALGRRRPYLIFGISLSSVALLIFSIAGINVPLTWYTLLLVGFALGISCSVPAWRALCSEIVRHEQIPKLRFWSAILSALGFTFGAGLLPSIAEFIRLPTVYALLLAVLLVSSAFSLWCNENTQFDLPPQFRLSRMWSNLLEPIQNERDFGLAFLSCLLSDMSWYTFIHQMLFFIVEAIGQFKLFGTSIASALVASSISLTLAGICMLLGILFAWFISESKFGTKPTLYIAGLIQAISCFIPVIWQSSFTMIFVSAGIFGFGRSAWRHALEAMSCEIIPEASSDPRLLGIYWLSEPLSFILSLVPFGAIIDSFVRKGSLVRGHIIVHGIMAALLIIATLLIVFIAKGQKNGRRIPTNSSTTLNNNNSSSSSPPLTRAHGMDDVEVWGMR